jgi:hypothetical protein
VACLTSTTEKAYGKAPTNAAPLPLRISIIFSRSRMFLLVTSIPGILPSTLRARLRRFKFAPGEFVFAAIHKTQPALRERDVHGCTSVA